MGSDRLMVLWIAMSVELMAPWGSEALDQAVISLCVSPGSSKRCMRQQPDVVDM